MLQFLQTQLPRVLSEKRSVQPPPNQVRALNLWILRHASIHANTCPSAHVASTTAFLLRLAPGVGLVAIAILILMGAVAGRYHYAADAIPGAMVALAAFLIQITITNRLPHHRTAKAAAWDRLYCTSKLTERTASRPAEFIALTPTM
jgi:hypothetical protein